MKPELGKLYRVLMDRAFFKNRHLSVMLLDSTLRRDSLVLVTGYFINNPGNTEYVVLQVIFNELIGFIWVVEDDWSKYLKLAEELDDPT